MRAVKPTYSIAVFPFLKTSHDVRLGGLTFRSTLQTEGLTEEQKVALEQVRGMLFLQNNLRIKSATYAIIPYVELRGSPRGLESLKNIQAVVAYLYASPRHEFGDIFLSSEHASLVIFSSDEVSSSMVSPDNHVEVVDDSIRLDPDRLGRVNGFAGLYNFKQHFWVVEGCRLYGPTPHLTLNIGQDLVQDLRAAASKVDFRVLFKLLMKPASEITARIFRAIHWFNAANDGWKDDAASIVDLSIAFEALLALPKDEKTERLTDAISLLLGRVPRVDTWAHQFYDARSDVVHEGTTDHLRFRPLGKGKQEAQKPPVLYQSLLSYGRQIFQLCLGALLVGAELAERASLAEKLITNRERFERICKILGDKDIAVDDRLNQIAPIVTAIESYQYVSETHLSLKSVIGATRCAAKVLLELKAEVSSELISVLEGMSNTKGSDSEIQQLEALQALDGYFEDPAHTMPSLEAFQTVKTLVKVVWNYLFQHYFWLKEAQHQETEKGRSEGH